MRALDRKLLRDLSRLKEQALAIAAVMACGIATFVMALSMIDSLQGALDAYYDRGRFAHIFAHATRAPLSLRQRLEAIPGVARVECRIAEGALLGVEGLVAPATSRIISLPDDPASGLNTVHLRAGRLPEGVDRREVLVSQRFAGAHGLEPGGTITAILNGRRETLRIVGIALSPEFIYLIPPGGILPEHDRYAVFWMGRREMEAAFDMEGAFNDVLVRLGPGASEGDVIDGIDALLARFGGTGAYPRADQPSHRFIANELGELRGMTTVVPVIFLAVAAFLLDLVLGRLIAAQRQQVATLRALGYSARAIGRHYLVFALAIAVAASALGLALGAWMGRGLTGLYAMFFDFPSFEYLLRPRVMVAGVAVGLLAGAASVAAPLRGAMRLPPAEAMRPPAPRAYHPMVLERLGLLRFLPIPLRMIARYLERHPLKTGLSILGVALATSILVVGSYTEDATDYLLDFQFHRVQRRDLDLVMSAETDRGAAASLAAVPGITGVEPYRAVAVHLRAGPRARRTAILGLARADGMHRLMGMYGDRVELPARGLVLSSTLADVLGLRAGDVVEGEVLEGRRPRFDAVVASTIDDFSGLAAYMDLAELNRLMGEPGTISGAYVTADAAAIDGVHRRLGGMPRILAVNSTRATEESFRRTIAHNLTLMRSFLIAFSAVIAVGVIYNNARVSLAERARDLATMRIVGFTRREVAAVQLGELAIVTLLGIPAGLALGFGLARLAAAASASEIFRMPFIISSATFALAALVILLASAATGLAIDRRMRGLDLIGVLKSRE